MKRVLAQYPTADFVLIIGDDVADEDAFSVAESFVAANPTSEGDRWDRRRSSTAVTVASTGDLLSDNALSAPSAPLIRRTTASSYIRFVPTRFMTVTNGAKSTSAMWFCSGTHEVWGLLRAALEADQQPL